MEKQKIHMSADLSWCIGWLNCVPLLGLSSLDFITADFKYHISPLWETLDKWWARVVPPVFSYNRTQSALCDDTL
jgi:hypothetical protein